VPKLAAPRHGAGAVARPRGQVHDSSFERLARIVL